MLLLLLTPPLSSCRAKLLFLNFRGIYESFVLQPPAPLPPSTTPTSTHLHLLLRIPPHRPMLRCKYSRTPCFHAGHAPVNTHDPLPPVQLYPLPL